MKVSSAYQNVFIRQKTLFKMIDEINLRYHSTVTLTSALHSQLINGDLRSGRVFQTLCGSHSGEVYRMSNYVTLQFMSEANITESGFHITYTGIVKMMSVMLPQSIEYSTVFQQLDQAINKEKSDLWSTSDQRANDTANTSMLRCHHEFAWTCIYLEPGPKQID